MEQVSQPTTTPLFLIWSIPFDCSLKSSLECSAEESVDLVQLERTLRPLRSLAMAAAESRLLDDICFLQQRDAAVGELENIKGCSISEVMDAFGGQEYLQSNCDACPANVYRSINVNRAETTSKSIPYQFAGCYGYLQSEYDDFQLFHWWQKQLDDGASPSSQSGFRLDQVWMKDCNSKSTYLREEHADVLLDLLESTSPTHYSHADLSSLVRALIYSRSTNAAIQIQAVPTGIIEGNKWKLPQHCSVCVRPILQWDGQCPNCHTNSAPRAPRTRNLRGDRPFWPIVRFLGQDKAIQIANQYFDHPRFDS